MVNKRGEVTIERGGENNKNEVYEENSDTQEVLFVRCERVGKVCKGWPCAWPEVDGTRRVRRCRASCDEKRKMGEQLRSGL